MKASTARKIADTKHEEYQNWAVIIKYIKSAAIHGHHEVCADKMYMCEYVQHMLHKKGYTYTFPNNKDGFWKISW